MGKIGLQFKATLENVTHLRPVGDDFRWYLKMKCGNCGEVSEKWQYLRLMDSVPLKGGRGSATMVQKCKLCSRDNSIDILSGSIKPYNAEDSEKFKTIVEFECRGLEPVDFQPQAGFAAEGAETGTTFSDINLLEKVQSVGVRGVGRGFCTVGGSQAGGAASCHHRPGPGTAPFLPPSSGSSSLSVRWLNYSFTRCCSLAEQGGRCVCVCVGGGVTLSGMARPLGRNEKTLSEKGERGRT
uniref:CXXC motif containing zinc binding protein n=1 Tax=Sarcophilus harrisii TaxID=9305 RepID=A0A7N4PMI5_SARHA